MRSQSLTPRVSEQMLSLQKQIKEMESQLQQLEHEQQDRKSLHHHMTRVWCELQSILLPSRPQSATVPENSDSFAQTAEQLIAAMRKRGSEANGAEEENASLKSEVSALVQENLRLKNAAKERTESEKSKLIEAQLREELRDEKERVAGLMDEMDVLKERLRCAEVVSNELKKQIKEVSSSGVLVEPAGSGESGVSYVNSNPVTLRQELKSVREVIAAREAMIKSLNDKYIRHRQVWEENERRANDEIKELDEIIDRVIKTLKGCDPAVLNTCPDLKRLFQDLTRDQTPSLNSTIV